MSLPIFKVQVKGRSFLRAALSLELNGLLVTPDNDGFLLTKTVEAESITAAENDVRAWAEVLADALGLVRGFPAEFSLMAASEVFRPPGLGGRYLASTAHVKQFVEPVVPLTADLLKDSVDLAGRISSHPAESAVRRAVSWYSRGLLDTDIIDRFVAHWISLETLSRTYQGQVDAQFCSHCGEIINPRPDRAVLRGFLDSIGFGSITKLAMKLNDIRGRLFHEAKALSEARLMQPALTSLLKECLLKILVANPKT